MKKNLRIASAAAAALLAVAPVAASAVNPANASVSFDNTQSGAPTPVSATKVAVNVNLGNIAGKKPSQVAAAAKVSASVNGLSNVATAGNLTYKFYKVTDGTVSPTAMADTDTFDAGTYVVEVDGLKINGLINNTSYTAQDGNFAAAADYNASSKTKLSGSDLQSEQKYSDSFTVTDSKLQGTPYFFKKGEASNPGSAVMSGSVSVTPSNGKVSLDDVRTAIKNAYDAKVDYGSATSDKATVNLTDADINNAIKAALATANVTLDSNDQFNVPANSVNVNVTVTASNGKQATLPITVNFGESTNNNTKDYPQMTVDSSKQSFTGNNNTYSPVITNDSWANVDVNGKVDTKAIENAFKAQVSGSDSTNLPVSVDTSKVNTAVAGTYPVTVSAKNAAGYTTKVTFNLVVGHLGAKYQTTKQDGNVYSINGNRVNQTNDTVKAGDNIATFDTVTVDGKEYVRINKSNSNQFVDASIFTKPAEEKTVSETVMYKSAIYNKDGKTTGKHISGYTDTDFAADKDGKPVEVTINGSKFLKLAGDKGYVRTRNVFGSEMTLKKNAYVYKSNGRRANKKLLKKGSTITVFGGQYRAIRHYRKNAVRIGHNRYIKVVNVNYKLAD